tara:strand:+ start:280 stop:687 length:408 start_codon:yes stop_codon:yes gene_type:complete
MIKLLDLLKSPILIVEGSQFGVLYHYTEEVNLENIIKSNTLQGPVSLTRSQDSFVKDWMGDVPIILLDKDKLRNTYKITPYRDYDGDGKFEDEMEERVNKDITNLNLYVIKVILPESNLKLESLLKEKNIQYEIK